MTKDNKIELMAPAGDFESLQAALDAGADSVYFGVEQLNMRARSTVNFTLDDLPEVVSRCRTRGVRTYLTLNTVIYDHDLLIVKRLLEKAQKEGITAVIASDQAVILMAREIGMEVHISTQQNISNIEAVRFYSAYADTLVLARELSLRQVKKITDAIRTQNITGPSGRPLEIEIFGHGALCMAISGKCYMSLHTYNSSANRGACKQNCRKAYIVTEKESGTELEIDNPYIMSPKDLCTIDILDQIIDAGVSVLKIEGRGRAPEYVYTVVKTYREAIDAYYEGTYGKPLLEQWKEHLRTVYNRDFWHGYYLGQSTGEWSNVSGSAATRRKVHIGRGLHYYPKAGVAEFVIESHELNAHDTILITGPTTGVQELEVPEMVVDDKVVSRAVKGDHVTFKLDFKIRPSDKLFKIETTEFAQPSPCN